MVNEEYYVAGYSRVENQRENPLSSSSPFVIHHLIIIKTLGYCQNGSYSLLKEQKGKRFVQ